jgi:uncharacterized membrane protein
MNLLIIIFWIIIIILILSIMYINKKLIWLIEQMSKLIKADNIWEIENIESKIEQEDFEDPERFISPYQMTKEDLDWIETKFN